MTSHGGSLSFGEDAHVQPGCYFVAVGRSIRVGWKAQIGPNCSVVGAGSVVTRSLPPGVVAGGSPAQLVRKRT